MRTAIRFLRYRRFGDGCAVSQRRRRGSSTNQVTRSAESKRPSMTASTASRGDACRASHGLCDVPIELSARSRLGRALREPRSSQRRRRHGSPGLLVLLGQEVVVIAISRLGLEVPGERPGDLPTKRYRKEDVPWDGRRVLLGIFLRTTLDEVPPEHDRLVDVILAARRLCPFIGVLHNNSGGCTFIRSAVLNKCAARERAVLRRRPAERGVPVRCHTCAVASSSRQIWRLHSGPSVESTHRRTKESR